MCSQQMENAKNDEKKDFIQSYFRNTLISPPTPIMGENIIWAKFTLNDVLIISVTIINFICNFQPFLYSALQHAFLAQLKI